MEIYRMETKKKPIKYGKYKELVSEKQKNDYGGVSARDTLSRMTKILSKSLAHKATGSSNNNVLLVGKVQSGKTSNLEMISALAFDNGFNLLIIYGGYDNFLLDQCANRFSETFEANDDTNEKPLLYTTEQDLSILDNAFFETANEEKRPIIICTMKRPNALNKVNDALEGLDRTKINAFIIDDEGDQASLNTNKKHFVNEKGEPIGSATYKSICKMKRLLDNPIYFSVTATPEANIFQPDISELNPYTIHLIDPANLYTGADVFHLNSNDLIHVIDEVDDNSVGHGILINSLKGAINYYLVSSALLLERGINSTEMIIHSYREKNWHKQLTNMVERYIKNIYDCVRNENREDLEYCYGEIEKIYNNSLFSEETLKNHPWNDHLKSLIRKVIKKNVKTIMQNSDGKIDPKQLKSFRYKIYIGGDLLQRGITFKHLICTYFSRWAKKGNMDTNLQRARWFGYRSSYIDLCKVFTTNEIKEEFKHLANIEDDLWSQFSMIEKGQMTLGDIVINADETNLNPTRSSVANFKKTKFAQSWNNQHYASFDSTQIRKNNEALEKLFSLYENHMYDIFQGRLDNKTSAHAANISKTDFFNFIESTDYIFETNPFNGINNLKTAFKNFNEICFEFMYGNGLNDCRIRSFSQEGKVSALQQGADSIDIEKQKYKGDAYVIGRTDVPCIQVFNVLPEINGEPRPEYRQFMYSIHFPVQSTSFIKK